MILRTGTSNRDTLFGSWQADHFIAGAGDDIMYGNGGADRFEAGDGNDRLHGGWDRDTMLGGAGNDTIYAEGGDDQVEGGEGSDRIYLGAGNDTVDAGAGDDLVEASSGNDLVLGGAGKDEIQGEGGDDIISGGKDDGRLLWGKTTVTPPEPCEPCKPCEDGPITDSLPGSDSVPGTASSLKVVINTTHDGANVPNPTVNVTVTETATGGLHFSVTLAPNQGNVADLRGLFFHVADETVLGSLKVDLGGLITGFARGEDATSSTAGMNVEGVKTGPFDIGVEFGANGIGQGDDIRTVEFTLFDASAQPRDLDLTLLQGMDFAARLTSFGPEGDRGGSLKLVGKAGVVETVKPVDPPKEPECPPCPPAPEAPGTTGHAILERVVIGDNLYGNDGRDTFLYAKGDGVDLIWDFQPGQDIIQVTGYSVDDVDAFTFVRTVENTGRDGVNPLDAGSHEKLAVILDASGDAILFNDLGDRTSTATAIQFADGTTLSVAQMLARAAQPVAPTPNAPTPAPLLAAEEVSATVKVVNAWWGGFQGEITVTANRAVTDWDVLLGTKWQVQGVWNAQVAGTTAAPLGQLLDLDDAGWNATLAAGQSVTVGFTAATGQPGVLANQAILDGLWIA